MCSRQQTHPRTTYLIRPHVSLALKHRQHPNGLVNTNLRGDDTNPQVNKAHFGDTAAVLGKDSLIGGAYGQIWYRKVSSQP